MTIQNIEDVMDRIMSLNRNLTEESLKTLLSASGWDREDILEGLRIFRNTNKNTVIASPVNIQAIDSKISEPATLEKNINTVATENVYSFNLKKKDEATSGDTSSPINQIQNSGIEEVDRSATVKNNTTNSSDMSSQTAPQATAIPQVNKDTKSENSGTGRAIFYILLAVIMGLVVAYFYSSSFAKFVNQNILGKNPTPNLLISENTTDNLPEEKNDNATTTTSFVTVDTGDTRVAQIDPNTPKLEDLVKQIAELKAELSAYKNSSSPKTIVKYVSQRGPTGATGKGIASVDATSTGFVINYTDKTSAIIPYSTTTILNILNSQGVCFRDKNSLEASSTDICLDKDSVLKLLNK